MTKNIFIAATGKDVGKSTISFALIDALQKHGKRVGFMKPVGQRWLPTKWGEVEEDVILMKDYFGFSEEPLDMNPVVIKRGFTEEYLNKVLKPDLDSQIIHGYQQVARDKDYVVIEGTGHAGVGAVLDKSNADVARLLHAKVVLLVKGGIGSAIDRLELNRVFFEQQGVQVIGVIANKVIPAKYDKVKHALQHYCKAKKLKLYGVIPYSSILSNPTLGQVMEELKPTVLYDTNEHDVVIDNFTVGASSLDEFIEFVKEKDGNMLLVFPTSRTDITFAIPNLKKCMDMTNKRTLTILFSGRNKPSDAAIEILKDEHVTLLWKKGDTYSLISELSSISIKTRPKDNFKIDEIKRMVMKNIQYKQLLSRLTVSQVRAGRMQTLTQRIRRLLPFR
jgi:hypothetical protein